MGVLDDYLYFLLQLAKDKEYIDLLQNQHKQGEQQLLTAKYELTEHINRLQFEMNLEISYGLCAILQSFNVNQITPQPWSNDDMIVFL